MKTFRTFCIISLQDTNKLEQLLKDDNVLIFKPDPTGRHSQDIDGKSFSTRTFAGKDYPMPEGDVVRNEVLLSVAEIDTAQNIMSTIHGGILLAYPHPDLTDNPFELRELNNDFDATLYSEKWYSEKFSPINNFYFGFLIWHIAVKDKIILYAIEKYKLSLSLYSFTPYSANPKYGQIFENYNSQYYYHTNAAFAIIAAFAAIEEIGLEIRSSKEKPRFLDNIKGAWNPTVLDDINRRLSEIGIIESERIDWVFRGVPTKVEEDLKPYFGVDSEWVDGNEVRDKSLSFPEAIHNASYLRNFIAAHKFNELTEFISPYDVYNIQNLVRRLILNKLSLWGEILKNEI